MKKYLYACIIIIFLATPIWAALTVKIDPASADSFPFCVGPHVYDGALRRFFVGASQEITDQDQKMFALSFAGAEDTMFFGLAPKKVKLDGKDNVVNPLHGAQVQHLVLLGRRPVVVPAQEPQSLYIVNKFLNLTVPEMLCAKDIKDAEGNVTAGIVALTSNAPGALFYFPGARLNYPPMQHEGSLVFAAVKKAGGAFGQKGAGIALVRASALVDEKNNQVLENFIDIPDAQTGEENKNRAAPLDGETEALKINSPAAYIEDTSTLHYSPQFGLYIGLQAIAALQETDGVRSIVRGVGGENGKLIFKEIAPVSAFSGGDGIIGAVGSTARVSIHRINCMVTSTDLDYLIVVGGNGDQASTRDQVFALPLVGVKNKEHRGMIAKKNSQPVPTGRLNTDRFAERSFAVAAQKPEDMPRSTDPAARVGGGPLGMPIADIFITLDTVFVSTNEPGAGQQPGIFYSQALFDEYGRIAQWSPWRRAGAADPIIGFAYDPFEAFFWFMSGRDARTITKVQRTRFGKVRFSRVIEQEFPQEQGGVQGIVEIPHDRPGLASTPGERLSIIVWLGNKKILITQVGADDVNNNFGPARLNALFSSSDGTLSQFLPRSDLTTLAISGGDLDHLGSIIAGALVTTASNGYVVVGGIGGIAVLADSNGNGFDALRGLRSGFFGLDHTLGFKKIGSFKHVRKLIADNDFLYVVTNKTIERVLLAPQSIATDTIDSVVLTDGSNLRSFGSNDSISDALIINGFALIATSAGLYYATGLDNVPALNELTWQRVELADGSRSSTRLFAVGPNTGFDHHGMVYVINSTVGLNQARIYRLIVDSSDTAQPVKKVPDVFFIKGGPSFLVNIGVYRNYVAADGASTFVMRSRHRDMPVMFEVFTPGLRGGAVPGERGRIALDIDLKDARAIGPMIKSVTTGQWLVVGDFGVRGNE